MRGAFFCQNLKSDAVSGRRCRSRAGNERTRANEKGGHSNNDTPASCCQLVFDSAHLPADKDGGVDPIRRQKEPEIWQILGQV